MGASAFSHRPPGGPRIECQLAWRSSPQPCSSVSFLSHLSQKIANECRRCSGEEQRSLAVLSRCLSLWRSLWTGTPKPNHPGRQLSEGWSSRIVTATLLKAQTAWAFGCSEWCNLHIWSRFQRFMSYWMISGISGIELHLPHLLLFWKDMSG